MTNSLYPAVILFRHGQTDFNAARRFQGQTNTQLNDAGREQARRSGEVAGNLLEILVRNGSQVTCSLTSDLCRAYETADIVADIIRQRLNLSLDFKHNSALREFDIGDLQGYTVEEFEKISPKVLQKFFADYEVDPYDTRYPGTTGESRTMLAARVSPLVRKINELWLARADRDNIPASGLSLGDPLRQPWDLHVWSTHGGVVDTLLELMNVDLKEEKRIVGNGDVLFLAPVMDGLCETGKVEGARKPGPFSTKHCCFVGWKCLKHYRIGDNIAARINPSYSK